MINMNNKLITLLLLLLAMTACNKDDEPFNVPVGGLEPFQNMTKCRTDGVYEGRIVSPINEDIDGVWCEITSIPDDALKNKAPGLYSWIYIKRDNLIGFSGDLGTTIRFRILEYEIDGRLHTHDCRYYNCYIVLIF